MIFYGSRQAKTLKKTFDGIFCSKLATGLESTTMVQAFRITRLPEWQLTLKVKFGGQKVK